jgi:RNA polymerase sigma-70 factor (sigma-E family)
VREGTDVASAAERSVVHVRDDEFAEYMAVRQGSLLRTAYLLCGDRHEAEDLLQTALAKLYLAWDKVRDPAARDAYARRILVNEHTSSHRRPWRRREVLTERLPDVAADPVAPDDGTADALWRALLTLPPRRRAVLVLRYYDQLTESEIAAALGVTVGTVKSTASRALADLRTRATDHAVLAPEPTHQEDR